MRRFSRFSQRRAWRGRLWLLLPALCLAAVALIIVPNSLQSDQSGPTQSQQVHSQQAQSQQIQSQKPQAQPIGFPQDQPDAKLRRGEFAGPFQAELVRVIDGDTFEARVRIWFGQEITTLVRIRGIDAPELKAKCGSEASKAQAARSLLQELLSGGRFRLWQIGLDKYAGRVLARVEVVKDPSLADDVAELMLASAAARPYAGGPRQSWC